MPTINSNGLTFKSEWAGWTFVTLLRLACWGGSFYAAWNGKVLAAIIAVAFALTIAFEVKDESKDPHKTKAAEVTRG